MNLGLTPDFLAFQLKYCSCFSVPYFNSHSYHTIYIFCLKRVPYKSKAKKTQANKTEKRLFYATITFRLFPDITVSIKGSFKQQTSVFQEISTVIFYLITCP